MHSVNMLHMPYIVIPDKHWFIFYPGLFILVLTVDKIHLMKPMKNYMFPAHISITKVSKAQQDPIILGLTSIDY